MGWFGTQTLSFYCEASVLGVKLWQKKTIPEVKTSCLCLCVYAGDTATADWFLQSTSVSNKRSKYCLEIEPANSIE